MLKSSPDSPPPGGERSFGELASQLVDDAKAYARAEVDLAKAVASDKAKSLRTSVILLIVAAAVAMAALNALCVAIFVALAMLMPTLLAGALTFLFVGAIAGGLGWLGWQKLRDAL